MKTWQGEEIIRLINRLKKEGMSSDKILDIIEYIEATDPKDDNDEKNKYLQQYFKGAKSLKRA